MTEEGNRVLEAAMQLSDSERAELAVVLEHSIGDGATAEAIEAAWLDQAERRRDELRSGGVEAITWQEVRQEMFEMIERARAGQAVRHPDHWQR